jgi:cytochrome b561
MYRKSIFSLISWLAISLPVASTLLTVASANEVEPVQDTIMIFYPYHALLVFSGLLLLFAGMICARYMKKKRWWLKAHKTLGIGGAASTLTGIALAVYMVSASGGLIPPAGLHAYIGITVSFMVLFTPFMGFVQLKKRDKRLRSIHRWSGRITIALMIINVYLGSMIVQSF